ncbi:MAG: (E)-4-hydroxy-3-methylbut-2-enyl-diphosphate synthase [Salinivirgaceae bacterium]
MSDFPYAIDRYKRDDTVAASVGDISIGGNAPIRIQSMCNTPTTNIEESVRQAIEIIEAGGELVRYTVRHESDAEAIKSIQAALRKQGYATPLVADVHFNAKLAKTVAQYVEKVRINPGNFIDPRARFKIVEYDNLEWQAELEIVKQELNELIDICEKHNTALRIGTNHGSLSDRIMSRYGNTVEGMVNSTMEFLRICHNRGFKNVVVSMKLSNVRIMTQAYRSIKIVMNREQMRYPLHLGVTEAGDGLSGRVKSAAGIGALLNDGLGDTIRVSLTESPARELPVANQLVEHYRLRPDIPVQLPDNLQYNPVVYSKRKANNLLSVNTEIPAVVVDFRGGTSVDEPLLNSLGYKMVNGKWVAGKRACEYLFVKEVSVDCPLPEGLTLLFEADNAEKPNEKAIPVLTRAQFVHLHKLLRRKEKWVYLRTPELTREIIEILQNDDHTVIILETTHANGAADQRAFFLHMKAHNLKHPVIVKRNYIEDDAAHMAVKAAADVAPIFIDGFGDGIWLTNPFLTDVSIAHQLSFEILQAARARSTATEFIACPSCGRTLFDIEKALAEVKKQTGHLHHLKIAVMGCIVNGPGEMADADYGYVGAAPGKVTLYKKKTAVMKNIPMNEAVDKLIELIKINNDWIAAE